jgi:RNA ligase
MALTIDRLFSVADLEARVASAHVRVRRHPIAPLAIANYTSRATYDRLWDDVTRQCRGLIWNEETGEVVARPFVKFFDLHSTGGRIPDRPPIAHEKLDGSLGILYRHEGAWAVATRGSFESDQAIWASGHLRCRYPELRVPEGLTTLVEIVYSDNRIVVDHGREDLVLLAAIDNSTGADVPVWEIDWWPGPMVEQHVVGSAADAYMLATSNAFGEREGLVLTWYRPGKPSLRVKVKHPHYVQLHRIVTGLTERDIWRTIVAAEWRELGGSGAVARVLNVSVAMADALPGMDELLAATPADFSARAHLVEVRLREAYAVLVASVDEWWATRPDGERRRFAEQARATTFPSLLFSRLDGRPWRLEAWGLVRPESVLVNTSADG